MEIRSIEIDFDADVLRINGKEVRDRAVKVKLPGPEGWPIYKLFNAQLVNHLRPEVHTEINVDYYEEGNGSNRVRNRHEKQK